jgi:hypothetical protein
MILTFCLMSKQSTITLPDFVEVLQLFGLLVGVLDESGKVSGFGTIANRDARKSGGAS